MKEPVNLLDTTLPATDSSRMLVRVCAFEGSPRSFVVVMFKGVLFGGEGRNLLPAPLTAALHVFLLTRPDGGILTEG